MDTDRFEVRDFRRCNFFWLDNVAVDEFLPRIGATAFAVYCYLCRFVFNETQVCWPSQSKMAESLQLNKATISRNLKVLVENNLIRVVSQGKQHSSTRYQLLDIVSQSCASATLKLPSSVAQTNSSVAQQPIQSCATVPEQDQVNKTKEQDLVLAPPSSDRVPTTESKPKKKQSTADPRREAFIAHLSKGYKLKGWKFYFNGKDGVQLDNLLKGHRDMTLEDFNTCLKNYFKSEGSIPGDEPYAYLAKLPRYHHGPLNQYGKLMDCAPAGVEL